MNTKDRKKICCQLYAAMEKGSQLIGKYNSLPRSYAGRTLFPVETHTIQAIGRQPAVTTQQLAVKMEKTPSAVSQIVKKLKEHELIELTKNPVNNREIFLDLNEKGRQIYAAHEALDDRMMERFAAVLEDFSVVELEKFIVLQRLLNEQFVRNLRALHGKEK